MPFLQVLRKVTNWFLIHVRIQINT